MKSYIGTKIVNAMPEERGNEEGYLVVYEDGYKSWSPKEVFERCYREISAREAHIIMDAIDPLQRNHSRKDLDS